MAKKKTTTPKKQPRKSQAPRPAVEPKPQLISAKPLTDTKLLRKKDIPKDKPAEKPETAKPEPQAAQESAPNNAAVAVPSTPAPRQQPMPQSSEKPASAAQKPSKKKRGGKPTPQAATTPQQIQRPVPAQMPVPASGPTPPSAAVSTKPGQTATVDTTATRKPRRKLDRRKLLRYATVLLVVAILPALGFWIIQKRDEAALTANQRLIATVSKKAVVPTSEIPSVSTVIDPSKVTQQFLRNAQKGDKVLVYFQAAQAVVYRPSTGQIVNMGPLSAPSPRVWLRAGSSKADIPKIGNETNSGGDFVVVSNDASVNQNYQHTIVIDLAGNRPDIAKKLAAQLHATVGQLPDNENKPDADLLVIIGSDNNRP